MSAYLGCETTLRAYPVAGDGSWAQKGAAVSGLFIGLFDLNPPSITFEEIDVSNMAQVSGSIKEIIQAGVTEYGQFGCQMDFDPRVDPFAILTDEEYWYEIEFNFLQDTPLNGNITWHFKGVLLENTPATPMDDRASTALNFRCNSIVTVVNS